MRDRVMQGMHVVAAVLLLSAMARAQAAPPGEPPIRITINPEARVSAALVGALPAAAPCGTAVDLPVKVVNLGFVTAALEAELVGDVPPGVTLDFRPEALKGAQEEVRMMHITLKRPGTVDITIAFRTHNEIPDLGGRDRIHFLMRGR